MEVDRTKRPRSSETSEPQPPTPSRAERHALLEQDALEKERIARQARLEADMAGAVLRRRAEQALEEEALELVLKMINAKNDDAAAAPKAEPVSAPTSSNAKDPAPSLPKSATADPASPTSPSSAASTGSRRTRVLPALSKLNKKELLVQAALHDASTTHFENQVLNALTVPHLRNYLYKLDEELYAKKIADGGSSSPSTPELLIRISTPNKKSQARRTKFHELG